MKISEMEPEEMEEEIVYLRKENKRLREKSNKLVRKGRTRRIEATSHHNRIVTEVKVLAKALLEDDPKVKDIAQEVLTERSDLRLLSYTSEDGFELIGGHWAILAFVEAFGELLLRKDGTLSNYIQTTLQTPAKDLGVVVTVQRLGAPTAHDLRKKAEAALEVAEKELKVYRKIIDKAAHFREDD